MLPAQKYTTASQSAISRDSILFTIGLIFLEHSAVHSCWAKFGLVDFFRAKRPTGPLAGMIDDDRLAACEMLDAISKFPLTSLT